MSVHGQPLLELGVTDGVGVVAAEDELVGAAGDHVGEVVEVGVCVEAEAAAVAVDVGEALADLDVGDGVVDRVGGARVEPVLGGDVPVAEEDGRQAGDGVVDVRDAVLDVAGLRGNPLHKLLIADARAAVRVNLDGVAQLAEVDSRDGGDGAAEGVARHDDGVVGVLGLGVGDGGQNIGLHLGPGCGKARVQLAVLDKVAAGPQESQVGDPVPEARGATEGEHDVLPLGVECKVAGSVGGRVLVQRTDDLGSVGHDGGTSVVAAGDGGP